MRLCVCVCVRVSVHCVSGCLVVYTQDLAVAHIKALVTPELVAQIKAIYVFDITREGQATYVLNLPLPPLLSAQLVAHAHTHVSTRPPSTCECIL